MLFFLVHGLCLLPLFFSTSVSLLFCLCFSSLPFSSLLSASSRFFLFFFSYRCIFSVVRSFSEQKRTPEEYGTVIGENLLVQLLLQAKNQRLRHH